MKSIFIVLACLAATVVQADVYRWVDDKGEVHFGDVPPVQTDAEQVKLPALNRAKPQPVPADTTEGQPSDDEVAANSYEVLEIVEPANDGTVRSNEQKVKVLVNVVPGLSQGHRIAIYLDGAAVGEGIPGTSAELQGVFRGTHHLQAKVVDDQGRVIIESATTRFYLRQATIKPLP
jgi:hypothetical protein